MVSVEVKDKDLVLHVKGFSKIMALRGELTIPLEHVRGATADPGANKLPKGLRVVGTSIPGLIRAGTFVEKDGAVFWDVHNPANAVVIELAHENFQRLVVEVQEPHETVRLIEDNIIQ